MAGGAGVADTHRMNWEPNTTTDAPQVLLVEDGGDDVELAQEAFRRVKGAGPLEVARDGVEALEVLAGRNGAPPMRPRLVLLDLKLPRLDGLDVLRHVKGDPALRTIPVVMLTSSAEERDIAECYRLGANGYLVKPVEFARFLQLVEAVCAYWLHQNRAVPPSHRA